MENQILLGDCLELLKNIPDNSIDSIVTDPPAGIAFMGKDWDKDKGGRDKWIEWMQSIAIECLRVIKPGGHAFVWSLPRTSHWTATAWENAGFEIRDKVAHIFGTGYPKSYNVAQSIEKLLTTGKSRRPDRDLGGLSRHRFSGSEENSLISDTGGQIELTTPEAKQWQGWGTALKPAREDWLLLRKPLEKGLSVAQNCLKWGVGAIDIDNCRIETNAQQSKGSGKPSQNSIFSQVVNSKCNGENIIPELGRWPANIILDDSEEVKECFPETKSGNLKNGHKRGCGTENSYVIRVRNQIANRNYGGDSGSASRFFKSIKYAPKINNSERGKNNDHPTVKSLELMKYLVRMITPKKGIVMDCFAGSGTTAIACLHENKNFIVIEKDEYNFNIIKQRVSEFQKSNIKNLFEDDNS